MHLIREALNSVDKSNYTLGTDQRVSARIHHAEKLILDRNSANCQNSAWAAEQMMALQRGVDYLLESVSRARQWVRKQAEKIEGKIRIAGAEATEDSM